MKVHCLFLLVSLGLLNMGLGQQAYHPCGSLCDHEAQKAQNPAVELLELRQDLQIKRHLIDQLVHATRSGDSSLYTIPVVFHVMHQGGLEQITAAEVQFELSRLNDAFRNRGYFDQGHGVDTHIEFCLANVGPDGLPTTGIEHIYSPFSSIKSRTENYAMRAQYNWDPDRYLNIYTTSSIQFLIGFDTVNVIGTAAYPTDIGTTKDAITIISSVIGVANDPEVSITLVHEIGHFLGLYHPFTNGCANEDCLMDGDRVCDTPPDNAVVTFEGCVSQNNCTTDSNDPRAFNPFTTDVPDLNNLYMDYNLPGCKNMFTAGQRRRMRTVLAYIRSGLLSHQACNGLAGVDGGLTPAVKEGAISCDTFFTPKVLLANFGTNTLLNATIHYQIDQAPRQTIAWVGQLPTGKTEAVLLPSQSFPFGQHALTAYITAPNGQTDLFAGNDTVNQSFFIAGKEGLPFVEGFEGEWATRWGLHNAEGKTWSIGSYGCNPPDNKQAISLSNAFFYETGFEDGLISPLIDLGEYDKAELHFDVAYGYKPNTLINRDELWVEVSTNCGASFDAGVVYQKDRSHLSTFTINSGDTAHTWHPKTCQQWRREQVDLSDFAGQEIMLRFVFSKYRNGLAVYLDNLHISGEIASSLADRPRLSAPFLLFPNPTTGTVYLTPQSPISDPTTLAIYSLEGEKIWAKVLLPNQLSRETAPISLPALPTGIYLFSLSNTSGYFSQKLSIILP